MHGAAAVQGSIQGSAARSIWRCRAKHKLKAEIIVAHPSEVATCDTCTTWPSLLCSSECMADLCTAPLALPPPSPLPSIHHCITAQEIAAPVLGESMTQHDAVSGIHSYLDADRLSGKALAGSRLQAPAAGLAEPSLEDLSCAKFKTASTAS